MLKLESLPIDSFFEVIWNNWSLKLGSGVEGRNLGSLWFWTLGPLLIVKSHFQKNIFYFYLHSLVQNLQHFRHNESWFHLIKYQFTMKAQNFFSQFFCFTRVKKRKKKLFKKKKSRASLQVLEMRIGTTGHLTQIEKKLNHVQSLSSLEEWVRFFLVGKVIRNSVPVGNIIKWRSRNIYPQDPPLIIKSTCANWKKGN